MKAELLDAGNGPAKNQITHRDMSTAFTFDPGCGQDLLRTELRVHIRHGDAIQPLHLLLECDRVLGLPRIVQLVEEAPGPLLDDTRPVCLELDRE